ncbi:hypothetical protein FH972_012476 [Carpinus fangiana]|uniref:Uncharacterized protein n=1 Tax=Carpinus fangiana TaxID=176857 RepID=A0A5N6R3W1_9ROSI|nr:hypothetical protein FH972_012476 [Carpinus fangiana]
MGRSPCCDEKGLKKGPWTPEEDQKLTDYISSHGHGSWKALPKHADLNRCGKSCRLRWTNYLKPDIKRGKFSEDEERKIINLHSVLGNKWSRIATQLPGRTDNEIKNYWNTHLRKKLLQMGIDPTTHKPRTDPNHLMNLSMLIGASANVGNLMSPWGNGLGLQPDPSHLARIQLLQNLLQVVNTSTAILSNPFEGFINGWEYMNPGLLIPQAPSNPQEIANSWANTAEVNNIDVKNSSLSENPAENPSMPALVSAPPLSTDHPNQFSTSIFEDWEKLMVDETSDSYWKDMLE